MTYEMTVEPKQNDSLTKEAALVQILVDVVSSRNLYNHFTDRSPYEVRLFYSFIQ